MFSYLFICTTVLLNPQIDIETVLYLMDILYWPNFELNWTKSSCELLSWLGVCSLSVNVSYLNLLICCYFDANWQSNMASRGHKSLWLVNISKILRTAERIETWNSVGMILTRLKCYYFDVDLSTRRQLSPQDFSF